MRNIDEHGDLECKYCTRTLSSPADQFYNLLKSKVTGQVINGVLIGCLTEDELEEAYREFKG